MENSWINLPVESSFLFDENVSRKWNEAYKKIGIDPTNFSSFSGKA